MFPDKRTIQGAELGDVKSESSKKQRADFASHSQPPEFDEILHSHQLIVYGRQAMRRLIDSNILISGMQGLGAEIAKNLILAGVKSITLQDEGTVEISDLSGSFVFSEQDLGKNRALASVPRLKQLNKSTRIATLNTAVNKEYLSNFQAVVFTDITFDEAIEYDDYCHQHQPPIAFIKSEVRGLFGSVYCDFGPEFSVFDVDGKEPHTGIIAYINNGYPARVTCVKDKTLEFREGDLVIFSGVRGMTELNNGEPKKIIKADLHSFTIDENTMYYAVYEQGGIVTQVKESKVLHFKPLRQTLKDPGNFVVSDLKKSPALLHLAFQALDKFRIESGHCPLAGSENDAQRLIALFNDLNNGLGDRRLGNIDPKLLRNFAFGSRAVLIPMATMFGGIVGQEVVKACSGKFHPIFQFFYFDSAESLPSEPLGPDDLKPLNCRYDAQISVFGSKLQKKLETAKVLLVGSGASGSEFLKNIALMGVCCDGIGKLTITDNSAIAKSELSRQFLFRDSNIGQSKSTVAASAASLINNRLRVEPLQNRSDHATDRAFDDTFWENFSVVIAAVGNENARCYLNNKCLYFQKALLMSGTLGTECTTQTMIPHLTDHYIPGPSMDPYEKEPPSLTPHPSPPHNINHCLMWAMSEFERLLETTPTNVNAYLSNPSAFTSFIQNAGDHMAARDTLEWVRECLIGGDRFKTFDDCISWARLKFENYFVNQVKHPNPLQFSNRDPSHLSFVKAAAILRAVTFGIPIPPEEATSFDKLTDVIDKTIVADLPPWKDVEILKYEEIGHSPLSSGSTSTSDDSTATSPNADSIVVNQLLVELKTCREKLPHDFNMNPIKFEKDDDTNFHMDLVAGLANLRARNYGIPEVDKVKAKFIKGRIIPKVATSTAVATGLVCLELYKLLGGNKESNDYRNATVNLAFPFFEMHVPFQPETFDHKNITWTIWDRWILRDNPTLRELIQWLMKKDLHKFNIMFESYQVYSDEISSHKEWLDRKLFDLVKDVPDFKLLPSYRYHFNVLVECENAEGRTIGIPVVSIYFK